MDSSQETNVKLINAIKLHPVLWQPCHSSYGKRGPRDAAYKKIGKEFPCAGSYRSYCNSSTCFSASFIMLHEIQFDCISLVCDLRQRSHYMKDTSCL